MTDTGLRFDANLKWLFAELPFLDRFAAAAAAGFAAVEYASPYQYSAAELRARLDEHGLSQVLINTPAGADGTPERHGTACIPGAESRFRTDFERALEYAVELGSAFIHVVAGVVPPDVAGQRADALLVCNVAWAAERASGTGVRLLLEAQNQRDVPGYALASPAHAAAVAETVGADRVGVLFDVYHAQIGGGDLIPRLTELMPTIQHIQIADPPGRHQPGTGEVNFRSVFRAIRSSGYRGWIGCEYATLGGGTAAGLGWMQEVA